MPIECLGLRTFPLKGSTAASYRSWDSTESVPRGNPRGASDTGIIAALTGTLDTELSRPGSVDPNIARATARSIEQAGIRPAGRDRRVGDYLLGALLGEGDGWQDFVAKHASLGVARRVRVYPYARAASPDERERLGRMAMREFRVLEGIDDSGFSGCSTSAKRNLARRLYSNFLRRSDSTASYEKSYRT